MVKATLFRNILLSIAGLITASLLGACAASNDETTTHVVAAMNNLIPKIGACKTVKDSYFPTLKESIEESSQIFLGKVTKFDPYIWNTPDGKAPAFLCTYEYDPFIPVHIQVLENLKGNLVKNDEVILLVKSEITDRTPFYSPPTDVEPDKENVWFTGEFTNYRKSNPANPLNYPQIYTRYSKKWNGWDGYPARGNFAAIDELKSLITKAERIPTPTAGNK